MKRQNQILGQLGEEMAAEFLKKNGYAILARNWKCKAGELDIVAAKKKGRIFKKIECIVFAEVKTIDAADAKFVGQAEENVNFIKQKHLIASARSFLVARKIRADFPWQIDVIAIEFDRAGKNHKIRHLEKAVWNN
jgi:putative endonuclease